MNPTPAGTEPIEVAWFSALCDDDYEFLGVPDPTLQSSWDHCASIVTAADRHNYDNVLLPSGYALGIDNAAFAAAIATRTEQIRLLLAIRMGEFVAPQVVRQVATLQQIAAGRLTMQLAPRSGLDPSTRRVPVLPVKQSYVKTPTKRGMPRGTCGRESVGPVPGPERQLWATLIRCATRYLSWPRPE